MSRVGRSCVLLALGCLGITAPESNTCAQEWTRFRGPNGSGVDLACEIPAQLDRRRYELEGSSARLRTFFPCPLG